MIDFHKEVIYLTPENHTGYRPSNQPMLERFAKEHQGFRIEWLEPRGHPVAEPVRVGR